MNTLHCFLQGSLPSWSTGPMMPALQFLFVEGNWNLTGWLPPQWGTGSSMIHLSVLSAHDCNFGGIIPANWSSQLPELQIIDLTNNLVSGISGLLHRSHINLVWLPCKRLMLPLI